MRENQALIARLGARLVARKPLLRDDAAVAVDDARARPDQTDIGATAESGHAGRHEGSFDHVVVVKQQEVVARRVIKTCVEVGSRTDVARVPHVLDTGSSTLRMKASVPSVEALSDTTISMFG